MSPVHQLSDALSTLRREWRRRVLLESAVIVLLTAIAAIVLGVVLAKMLGPSDATVTTIRVVGYVLIVAALGRFLVWPLARRASDERFALYVEEHAPELRQGLLSAVHELALPEERRASASLTARLIERVLVTLRSLKGDRAIERPRTVRAVRGLGAAALVAALLLAFGPSSLRMTASMLFTPWGTASAAIPVLAVSVEPGDASVPKGGSVDVSAKTLNFMPGSAEIVFRADTSQEWTRLPMAQDSAQTGFSARLFDLTHATEYYVESEGIRSNTFKLSVVNLPAVSKLGVELRFPAYTGLEPEKHENGGDVAAIVGTTVILTPTVTMPVRSGAIRMDNGTTIPMTVRADGQLVGSFKVNADGFYKIDLVAEDGRVVPGRVQYAIEAMNDRGPAVFIDKPGRDTRVTNVEEVAIAPRATDDFGVTRLELRYSVNGGDEKRIVLSDTGLANPREVRASHTLFLEELNLQPGDLVAYHAAARDGAGNQSLSDVYFLDVRPFGYNYRQAEQRGGGGGGGEAGQGENENPAGFVPRQKEVVAGTFNWLRDSARTADQQRRDNLTTINTAQGRLREDVATLIRQLTDRGIAQEDSTFARIQRELEQAVAHMDTAVKQLSASKARAAQPSEQKALQYLQRADAMYRERQLQMGGQQQGGGGGGGGQQQRAEELADLFELERDKLANQYEAVQQQAQQQQQAQREVDETLERMRQLASRQQQENERMQRGAEAMRDRVGQQQSGGGGGGAQRDLARQAEEEARRLERLAREQRDQQQAQQLEQAAEQMRRTAEEMRRAAATGNAAQGQSALEQLRNAQRGLENARTDALNENVRKLAETARDMQQRQEQMANDVKALESKSGEERANATQQVIQQAQRLSNEVSQLEQDADRMSREARREQPRAATRLGDAAESIRDNSLRQKVDYTQQLARASGVGEMSNALQQQIRENLAETAAKLDSAVTALSGEPQSRQQDRAMENIRDLVRGMESTRDRFGERTGTNQEARAGQQQGQQQGQQGQQGGQQQGQQQGGQQQGQQSGQQQRGQAQGQQQGNQQGQAQGQQQNGQQQGQAQGQQQGQQQGQAQGQQQGNQRGQAQGQQQNGQQQGQSGQQQGQQQNGQQQGQQNGRGGRETQSGDDRSGGGGYTGQVNRLNASDARQFNREFASRRADAENLRNELRQQGVNTRQLDSVLTDMRRLENMPATGDPRGLDALQADVIAGLKNFEFSLFRQLGVGSSKQPATGVRGQAPAGYQEQVAEYFRQIAKPVKKQ